MGSICHIYRKEYWKILKEETLKETGETVFKVLIGDYDDYDGMCDIEEWVNKKVYAKIMNGEYKLKLKPYHEQVIEVLDGDNNIINLITGDNLCTTD